MLSAGGAQARDHGRYGYYDGRSGYHQYYRHHDRGDHGDALAAGVIGLALGAALTSGSDHRYGRDYGYDYGPRYYAEPRYGYYERPYRTCRTVRLWDPYYGSVYERRCW